VRRLKNAAAVLAGFCFIAGTGVVIHVGSWASGVLFAAAGVLLIWSSTRPRAPRDGDPGGRR
jgi:hypothetical protein